MSLSHFSSEKLFPTGNVETSSFLGVIVLRSFLVLDMAAPNTRVRVVSTTELGAIRYKQLLSEGKWLVEFRHADGAAGASFGAAAVDANRPKLSVKSCSSPFTLTDSFVRARRGEWRLLAKIPAEEVNISVESGREVIFQDKCTIAPPDAPLENNRAASSLKSRSSSGAVQRSVANGSGASGAGGKTWPVDFIFSENVVGVREVFVVLDGDHDDVRCEMEEGDDDRKKYVATVHLPAGPCRYRFRIVFRESQNPESAPLTRLGYDAGLSHQAGLVTWDFSMVTKDLSTGAQPESFTLDHEKGLGDMIPSAGDSTSAVNSPTAGDEFTSGVSVREETKRLDEAREKERPVEPVQSAEPVAEPPAAESSGAQPPVQPSDQSTMEQIATFLGSAPGIGLSVVFAIVTAAALSRRERREETEDEDDDGKERIFESIRRFNV